MGDISRIFQLNKQIKLDVLDLLQIPSALSPLSANLFSQADPSFCFYPLYTEELYTVKPSLPLSMCLNVTLVFHV